jgi:hypothetical protein
MAQFTNRRELFDLIKGQCGTCLHFNTFLSKPNMNTGHCSQLVRAYVTPAVLTKAGCSDTNNSDLYMTVPREGFGCLEWAEPMKAIPFMDIANSYNGDRKEYDRYVCKHLRHHWECWECHPNGYTMPDDETYLEGQEMG